MYYPTILARLAGLAGLAAVLTLAACAAEPLAPPAGSALKADGLSCPDPADPNVVYLSHDPLECAAGLWNGCGFDTHEIWFDNGCGCGCLLTDSPPPCDDHTSITCDETREERQAQCANGEIAALVQGCFDCVDPATCEPSECSEG